MADECTIDYLKPEIAMKLIEQKKREWMGSYGVGSVAIKGSDIYGGDTVTLVENRERKVKELEEVGCKVEYYHDHPEFGVSHIHIVCPEVKDPYKVAQVLALEEGESAT